MRKIWKKDKVNTFRLRAEVETQTVLLKEKCSKEMGVVKRVLQKVEVVGMVTVKKQDLS